ncbi:hypothetical protein BpHYR1_006649, partial [Brachionus plicatilis]
SSSSSSTVDLDFTTFSGSLFQCGTTLFEKNTCLALTAAAKSLNETDHLITQPSVFCHSLLHPLLFLTFLFLPLLPFKKVIIDLRIDNSKLWLLFSMSFIKYPKIHPNFLPYTYSTASTSLRLSKPYNSHRRII